MLGIIIPAYNRPERLRNALESLNRQTMKRFIVYVVDDASTEDLKSICDEYNKIINVVYIRSDVNEGPGASRMKGLDAARVNNIELVMFLDSDDELLPHAVQTLTHEINHGLYDIIASSIVVEHKNEPFSIIQAEDSVTWFHGKIYRVAYLNKANIILPKSLRTNEDLGFNLVAFGSTKNCGYIPVQTYVWNDDKSSITRNKDTEQYSRVTGVDYIRAIHFATFYLLQNNPKYNIVEMVPNIISCYNYYQICLSRGGVPGEEIDRMLFDLITLPQLKRFWKTKKAWGYINKNVWAGVPIEKEVCVFDHTFKEWFIQHGGELCQ